MDYKKMLQALPHSYDDFVNDTADWMERDSSVKEGVLEQLRKKPDSTPSDILKIVCEKLGMTEPLEIDEDEPRHKVRAAML